MASFFRSESMVLAQLFIQSESACHIVTELGKLGVCQFIDLNSELSAFQRKYINVVRRCHRIENNLASMEEAITNAGFILKPKEEDLEIITLSELMDLEITIDDTDVEVKRLIKCYQDLQSTYLTLVEMQSTLLSSKTIFDEIYSVQNDNEEFVFDDDFDFIAGVIDRRKYDTFERVLWRLSRGNIFVGKQPIEENILDPVTGEAMYKEVFVIFYKGALLKTKIRKLCDGFKVTIYPCPKSEHERNDILTTVDTRLRELKIVIKKSKVVLHSYLRSIANEIPIWRMNVIRIKAVYHILNGFTFKVGGTYLIGECWLPEREIQHIRETLERCKGESGSYISSFMNIIETEKLPPTMFKTNKFTICYQNIIDAYGILRYKEANPALFSIITFPFLFGVMFGDVGHAIILILFATFLIIKENELIAQNIQNEIFTKFFDGRYVILLMGLFSMYAGFLYNEVFSQAINIFGNTWTANFTKEELLTEDELTLSPSTDHSGTYAFGIDPIWVTAKNKIIFFNSLKMKMSVIMGVLHMIFGVGVSVTNHIHFKQYEKIFLEFIPQILLLCSTFLWLVIMIFMKWIMYSAKNTNHIYGTSCAPSILIYFIDMMLFKRTVKLFKDCRTYMFEYQEIVQKALYLLYLVCIPWMLFGKTIYHCVKKLFWKKEDTMEDDLSESEQKDDEESFVYQAIHTIEFVLGTVSHTASYLRLWALSLAHSQLSEVLWENILCKPIQMSSSYFSAIFLVIVFAIWMFFTVSILIVMEGLSAFLHTLRLHWVEFMSKFYKGGGYVFRPFDLKSILKEDIEVSYLNTMK